MRERALETAALAATTKGVGHGTGEPLGPPTAALRRRQPSPGDLVRLELAVCTH